MPLPQFLHVNLHYLRLITITTSKVKISIFPPFKILILLFKGLNYVIFYLITEINEMKSKMRVSMFHIFSIHYYYYITIIEDNPTLDLLKNI